jgi:FemAB-related protein (PEP-CTERM system-associated)
MTENLHVRPLGDGDAGRWDAFVNEHPAASPYHRAAWDALFRGLFGHETAYLIAEDSAGRVRGVLPIVRLKSLLFGNFAISVPYFNYGGPLADSPESLRVLVDAGAEQAHRWHCSHLELRCVEPLGDRLAVRTNKVCMLLDLARTPAEQLQALGSKLRAQIKRPQRDGAQATVGGEELLPDFYDVFARNMRDLGTPVYGADFFRAVYRLLEKDAALAVVRIGSRAVAAGFLIAFRDSLQIPWASSLREFNRSGVNMLLYWEALQHAIARGCRVFDFGRSTPGSGTYRFKEQWGAQPRQLYWNYWTATQRPPRDLSPANPRFQLAVRIWRCLPLALTNRIGPHIVRSLP